MLDRWTANWVQPPLARVASRLATRGVSPDQITLAGFAIGMLALPLLAVEAYGAALVAILLNRLADGLDGALARHTHRASDAGGFLDIGLDFVFYAAVVVGFALADPAANALAAVWLLFAFVGTGSTFLAFAIMAARHRLERPAFPHKAFFYLDGLTEGTETILAFVAFCLWPGQFVWLAGGFTVACLITTLTRLWGGYRTLCEVGRGEASAGTPR
ncbi:MULTISPECIES: CDP-alcohol phosphatidyltransferase family protein [unclassified Modicisalibacter]|uniref:CDP-alcohol phosphatidyltransferase family protein n=1 Tax=unclassified Modicisalibacter TaxID=2679913 RepID=UPI001CCED45E|nr:MULTISPECIES: CDP-alcohol phosphatidyltransferase family protein [unclassified Modicisalibacter]MBZ9560074.1 CDP-alcohol phosphatidyltransferase family protein [Modicisalibacter sp. R2A 31.J]MBZ9575983.1 CDP-alcohol phosphatidyltransferase family protein [Modicisalibacter sp. MOD 31.J]